MSKTFISVFLTLLFVGLISAPTMIMMVDESVDVSAFYSIPEEEEKGKEKHNDIEILVLDLTKESKDIWSEDENNLEYYFNSHLQPHLNLISPPPERV